MLLNILFWVFVFLFFSGAFCVFFDQAIFSREGTIYKVNTDQKKVALTFDDGPSPIWTPQILHALKEKNVKATFFMIGYHVQKYPDIARQVARDGHTIANHGYAHSVILYYKPAEIEEEIKYTEEVIRNITGKTTRFFRPPKAWLRPSIKEKIISMGYNVILWSLNSKDWVCFNHRYIVSRLVKRIRAGDIILFHDSGNIYSTEGGVRRQTVKAIPLLIDTLRKKGFEFVSIDELINISK